MRTADGHGSRRWDRSLYAGSARYYATGRARYPHSVIECLVEELRLDGSGRLLDVGCGPGSLTLLLAPWFGEAIGVDADADMLVEAAREADRGRIGNVRWRHLPAEDLPADLPAAEVVTFAQSFHWMDQHRVAAAVRRLLVTGGAVVHVHATTHRGIGPDPDSARPAPPWTEIGALVNHYLGPHRRAGQGLLPHGPPTAAEDAYRAAGLTGPHRIEVAGYSFERTTEQIVASVYSQSGSAPHLFGARLAEFDHELRRLVTAAADQGRFAEQMREIALDVWR